MSKVTKLEHSSLLIEHKGKRLLFDPGVFSSQNEHLHNIDYVLITHSHGDHLNVDNIKYVESHSPNAKIITNTEVAKSLTEVNSDIFVVEGNVSLDFDGIKITAHDHRHEEIYKDFGQVQNTGYYIDDLFFHPGDSFTKPNRKVKAIATVIVAPFMRAKTAIEYINSLPEYIHFGVHDGVASKQFVGWLGNIVGMNLLDTVQYIQPTGELISVEL